ncbi:MAG: Asp-tRNA(Asn)/Glu-tRNA(Gln) amidotransferase subunit GatA [Candidatus Micrarchaeota archaeon]|nr:Asp-tRNA(Asn)/Glu-tRNA(Gln) amidotransferase subunit GatA [Candidatus Micrarchaeota archaeon]
MTSSIREFASKKKPGDYYQRLAAEVEELNKEYHAFTTINASQKGKSGAGVPFSSKANICVKGFETTAGSKMLRGYVPPFNATVIERMLASGEYSFIGETNMDEFGFGSFGLNTEVPARNAFDKAYVAGGSSSGAAVATALLKYHVALAESTGGSIATPAALNGVVGFTPTYGAVSRYGLIDYANSLDKIGVISRSAADARTVFDLVRGADSYDTTCVVGKIRDEKKERFYVVKELLEAAEAPVKRPFEKLVSKLESMGRKVERISLGILAEAIEPYYIIAMAEASTNLAKYNGYKYGLQYGELYKRYDEFFTSARENFGTEAKRRIILGTFIRGESVRDRYYTKALVIRRMLIESMQKVLEKGFLLSPTIPILTPKISDASRLTPVQNYAMDLYTIPPNLGGFPHISFPYDYVNGMPVGAQLVAAQANDYSLLGFVDEWEKGFAYRFAGNVGDI